MADHVLYGHATLDECPQVGSCQFCDGGLSLCTVCGGAEATLPQECPGYKMSNDECDAVQAGARDFVDGKWRDCVPVYFNTTPRSFVRRLPLNDAGTPIAYEGYEVTEIRAEIQGCRFIAEPLAA